MSLIEQYNASIKDLCNIYNVPVTLFNNTESSTYNNVKEAKKALYQNCVIPELIKIQDELNRWLAPMYGDNICIEYDFSVIPELQEETDKIVEQMSKAWWLTPNEKRAAMSYDYDDANPILDEYYIPANLIPASGANIEMPDIVETETNINEMPPDHFATQSEAESRANQMGGAGSHSHNGFYMPFNTHQEYLDNISDKSVISE